MNNENVVRLKETSRGRGTQKKKKKTGAEAQLARNKLLFCFWYLLGKLPWYQAAMNSSFVSLFFLCRWISVRKYVICKQTAEVTLTCILSFCSSSRGDQRLNQIKLSFNEHKEVQKTSRGERRKESLPATYQLWKADSRGWEERGKDGGRRQREMWASSAALARLKGQRLSIV